MATEVRMPRIGHSMEEGTLVAWLVEPGAPVRAGTPLVAVETDKAEFEVESPAEGRLATHEVAVGETVAVGTVLGWVAAPGEAVAVPPPQPPRRVRASPKARRLAEDRGLDLADMAGSGPDGLVTAEDVERAAGRSGAPEPSGEARWQGRRVRERRPLSALERATARRTVAAWTSAPHFVQMLDVDMGRARALREDWKRQGGPLATVTIGDVCVAVTARALAEHPSLNAAVDGGERVLFAEVNVGVAVDTPRGLVVPVIRAADALPLAELSARVRALAAAAREQRLAPADLEAGSVTVSNLGAFGIRAGTPVLNPPEALLVFVGALEDRVVARDGDVAIRPMLTLSIAYDHRVVDGAAAARLSTRIRELLEDPVDLA
jgi:pyruvate/2-oxoglutarate dehydrogenase complex dihydrolipoamide acyltransferase (E2) component